MSILQLRHRRIINESIKRIKRRSWSFTKRISQKNYSYFETGQTILTEDILIKLANFYDTNIDYLLYRTDYRKPLPKSILKEEDNLVNN